MEYLNKLSGLYQFDRGRGVYGHALSWEKVDISKIHKICVGEMDGNGKYVTHSFVASAEHPEGLFLETPPVRNLEWHTLFAVGLAQGESFSINALYGMDPSKTVCKIPCACGTMQWSISSDKRTGASALNITSSADIPEGIVYLCYSFAGVDFKIGVPDLIRAGNQAAVYQPFFLPPGSSQVRLETVGTAIELQSSTVSAPSDPGPATRSSGGLFGGLFKGRRGK